MNVGNFSTVSDPPYSSSNDVSASIGGMDEQEAVVRLDNRIANISERSLINPVNGQPSTSTSFYPVTSTVQSGLSHIPIQTPYYRGPLSNVNNGLVGDFGRTVGFLRDIRRSFADKGVAPYRDIHPYEFAHVVHVVSGGMIKFPTPGSFQPFQETGYQGEAIDGTNNRERAPGRTIVLQKRPRVDSGSGSLPQAKRICLDIRGSGLIEDAFDMDLPQLMRRELVVSGIERHTPTFHTFLLRRTFRDLCGRMRIYSLTSHFSLLCFEYMTGGCAHEIISSIENIFRDWSQLAFIEAVGKQDKIRSFLLYNLVVPVHSGDTMSNHEKDEWKIWEDVLSYSIEHDIKELEISFERAVSSKWKMHDTLKEVMKLPSNEKVVVIDVVEALVNRKGTQIHTLERFLWKLIDNSCQLPTSLSLRGVQRLGKNPHSGGGFADVWKGIIRDHKVALKALRIFGMDKATKNEIERECCKEAMIWRKFIHPNILPFLGICDDEFAPQMALVSPWMENGNIHTFLKQNPTANRLGLLIGVARGLKYLHCLKPRVVHGDLRGVNVLVDDHGVARLADFGLAKLEDSKATTIATSFNGKGSIRWQAPELLDSGKFKGTRCGPTLNTDIYSFACVCIEIFTQKAPFSDLNEYEVIMAVAVRDERPSRPPEPTKEQGLSDEVWDLMQRCWIAEPFSRPSAGEVLDCLSGIHPQQDSAEARKSVEAAFQDHLDVFWREKSNGLAFPDNFTSVSALLERGRRWHNGPLCAMARNFVPTPQECELEKLSRTCVDKPFKSSPTEPLYDSDEDEDEITYGGDLKDVSRKPEEKNMMSLKYLLN